MMRMIFAVLAVAGLVACHHDGDGMPPLCGPLQHVEAGQCVADGPCDGGPECTNDPCQPSPCGNIDTDCVVQGGKATCQCHAGMHDEAGQCVVDKTCSATSCGQHGTCSETATSISCTCETGWGGLYCTTCDAQFHDDGAGGCTRDPCAPNPCSAAHRGQCGLDELGGAMCSCDAGYHYDGANCLLDETCTPTTCSGHGSCSVTLGLAQCTCTMGYLGTTCAACDAAGGYHDDGAGGCTKDACLPNPCTAAHKSQCNLGLCSCDAGYHDDGAGGCSNDPCTPNPCLAQNKACMVVSGVPQCYTPACDDQNPCTDDALVAGSCQHVARTDGSLCQTSLCISGQTCLTGTCTGNTPRDCSDGNPCTDDSCSLTLGCQHANNDGNTPSDGRACTTDKCSAGVVSHTPSHAACDDGLYCTGVELCDPTAGDADAAGCRHTSVPQPPYDVGPCQTIGACSEVTHTFALTPTASGFSCSDGISCTGGDACDGAGACVGTANASCGEQVDCTAGSAPLGATLDVSWASMSGTMLIDGAPLPAKSDGSAGGTFYLRARDTGILHLVANFSYSGLGFSLVGGTSYDARVVPGVYDVLFQRNCSPDSSYCDQRAANQPAGLVNGYRVVRAVLVVGPGANHVDLEVKTTTLSGNLTVNGAPPPANSNDSSGVTYYLRAKDTGVLHLVGNYTYSGLGFSLVGSTTYAARLVEGTYDLLYQRNCSTQSSYCDQRAANQAAGLVNGYRLIKTNVVVSGTTQTLDLDVPFTTLSGNLTINGAPPPMNSNDSSGVTYYLKAKDTGVLHLVGNYAYSGLGFSLVGSTAYTARLIPGTYELLYQRNCSTQSSYCDQRAANQAAGLVSGYRVLNSNVVVSGTTQTMNLDVPFTTLSGNLTVNGAAPPANSNDSSGVTYYLKAKDTGVLHLVGNYSYSGLGFSLVGSTAYTARLIPGAYDLLYQRNCSTQSSYCDQRAANQPAGLVNGYQVLRKDVLVSGATQSMDLDVPFTTLTGNLTMNGGAPPMNSNDSSGVTFYLQSKETGVRHLVGNYAYSGLGFSLVGSTAYTARIVPGTYDVLYQRNCSPQSSHCDQRSVNQAAGLVNGYRLIQTNVVISGATQTLTLDVPMSTITGQMTVNGAGPPSKSNDSSGVTWYLKARDTDVLHLVGNYAYSGLGFNLSGSTAFAARLIPGAYDVLYQRNCSPQNSYCDQRSANQAPGQVNGYDIVRQCVTP